MPRVPGLEPPDGGGAAERLHQFEQQRGLEPDAYLPDPDPDPDSDSDDSRDADGAEVDSGPAGCEEGDGA